ncbi:ATPase domain-containing protein [Methanonatronarchaeum sp. AMET6-2]|uniref:RAD55 family ATPase n=1 Tax=Methanonatronarchaeum sp. AMET6-2 TaxID=2933293 RepID=UPI001FF39D06|nr:ATPase domain-containing protein [Methanonatronarchaeum sp. AMET6-2]UOY10492.1 AAA family ATPase [Methanonatronarchaeum sp. AMET6-2]
MSNRVPTGIYGFDEISGNGFRKNSVNIVFGGTGVGKTTFGLQYCLYGLNRGEKVIYVSLEMDLKQILRDCRGLGWGHIENYIENGDMQVIHEFEDDVLYLSRDIIKSIKEAKKGETRIVIDPLTPLAFAMKNKNERKAMSRFFQELRKLGTTIITYEKQMIEKGEQGESVVPLYLADSVIELENLGYGELFDRTLRIIKHRGSKHGEGIYPISIMKGLGIVVEVSEEKLETLKTKDQYQDTFNEYKQKIEKQFKGDVRDSLLRRIEAIQSHWTKKEDPEQLLQLVIETEKKQVV